jgi:hypothetical protein
MAQQNHAAIGIVAEVDVVAAAGSGDERVGRLARVGALGDGLIQRAHLADPPEDVAAAIAPRHAPVQSHGEIDGPAGAEQVLDDLAAGGARPDDEHRARR